MLVKSVSVLPASVTSMDPILLQNKAIQCVPVSAYSSRFIAYDPSFFLHADCFQHIHH